MPTTAVSIVPRFYSQQTLTPASVGASTVASQTFAVTGLRTDMIVFANGPAPTGTACVIGGRCSAADTLQLDYANPAGANTPVSGTYTIIGF